jgi:hypothetical protein
MKIVSTQRRSLRMIKMTKLSKSDSDGGGVTPAVILEKVYETHRRSHHFSLKKNNPRIYTMNLSEIDKFSILVAQEAYDTYKEAKQADGKKPHPNYFMAICRRLAKNEPTVEKNIWGKTI